MNYVLLEVLSVVSRIMGFVEFIILFSCVEYEMMSVLTKSKFFLNVILFFTSVFWATRAEKIKFSVQTGIGVHMVKCKKSCI